MGTNRKLENDALDELAVLRRRVALLEEKEKAFENMRERPGYKNGEHYRSLWGGVPN